MPRLGSRVRVPSSARFQKASVLLAISGLFILQKEITKKPRSKSEAVCQNEDATCFSNASFINAFIEIPACLASMAILL